MKKIVVGLLTSFIISCSSPKTDTVSSSTTESVATSNNIPANYSDSISGTWVSDQYLEKVKKTKSVYANKIYTTKVLFFNLNQKELLEGSAKLYGFSQHEGGIDTVIKFDKDKKEFVKNGEQKGDNVTFKEDFELKLNAQNKLEMYFPIEKKTDVYQKLKTDLQTELRNILFAGNYSEKGSNSKVSFSADGKVNFKDYTDYEVVYDFATGPNFDGIILHKGNIRDFYQYKISGENLELQLMQGNENNLNLIAKGPKYILSAY